MKEAMLRVDQQLQLIAPFLDADIKEAICSILLDKSPRPDGYSSSFYKACWAEIGPKICGAVHEFFSTNKMLKQWNATRYVLIPKVISPNTAAEF